jgi:hypothetical protein
MVDLYFKNEFDITYDEMMLEETSELQNLLSQLKMILFTNIGDVLGSIGLGMNLEKLIFETNYNKFTIINILKNQIKRYLVYDNSKYSLDFDLNFIQGTVRDIAVLTIFINGQTALDLMIK